MSWFIFALELIGTAAFAVTGALLAARKRMDIFGVCVMGLVSACGGGVLRDVLLGALPPVMFREPVYAIVAVLVSAAVFLPPVLRLLTRHERVYDFVMLVADAVGLGIFTAIGVTAAMEHGFGNTRFFAVFLGVVTGVGGGVMRDIMAGLPPYIFVKHIYACASILGALLCVLLWRPLGSTAAVLLCCGAVSVIRFLAAYFRWSLPKSTIPEEKGGTQ